MPPSTVEKASWTALGWINFLRFAVLTNRSAVLAPAAVLPAKTVANAAPANPTWRCPARLCLKRRAVPAPLRRVNIRSLQLVHPFEIPRRHNRRPEPDRIECPDSHQNYLGLV